MLQSLKPFRASPQPFNPPTQKTTPFPLPFQLVPISSSYPTLKRQCRFSRRELAIYSNSCLLLLLGAQALDPSTARAEEERENLTDSIKIDQPEENLTSTNSDQPAEETLATAESDQSEENLTTNDSVQPEETSATAKSDQSEENLTSTDNDQPEETSVTTKSDEPEENSTTNVGCSERKPTQQVFFDISIDGEPAGRITIGLFRNDIPAAVDRFTKLVSGAAGISYRRKEFVKIMPNYVQHGGIRSYGVDAELAQRAGGNFVKDSLVEEWERTSEKCPGTKNVAGSVGIIVRDPTKPPPKLKLVAKRGKLEIDQEEIGTDPNGTEFVITTKDSPELDASTLVIGRVIGGMDVVQRIGQVKTVQENTGSPYFRVAKLIGDKRAVVAERGFNRPYSKVIVTNCGVIQ
ncbi:hypothetical protein L6164_014434 [Bauhinia variegata]|uniref:Uncharacterized protein n=1 Tax=Bauhinia variegata TaxID=167791 RepID=A0ACB9NM43_BAUVA|nr:hypothetical protein L6164_014434 [Bauhinia variegata]